MPIFDLLGPKKAKKGPNAIFGFGTENMVGFNCGRGVVTGLWPRSCSDLARCNMICLICFVP